MKAKDFQEATADRIVELFKSGEQKRVLLADEVGLGKTIIARTVVQKVAELHRSWDDHFKVVYICSNINIANQNCRKLGVPAEDRVDVSQSRLSMQHLRIYETEASHGYQQLIPMTPSTSFSMTGGQGTQEERALILMMLYYCSEFGKYYKNLYKLMKFEQELKRWDLFVEDYARRIDRCNDKSGGAYYEYMRESIAQQFAQMPQLHQALLAICEADDAARIEQVQRRNVVNELRRMFAKISLDRLEPDLVIMDEFQRFKDLIAVQADDNESSMLAHKFLFESPAKILLLSATPYKPYSTLEELSEQGEDHYQEFMQVIDFLLHQADKQAAFHEVWKDYSAHLSELAVGDWTVLAASKDRAQSALYQCMCRTERRSDAIVDLSRACDMTELCEGDVLSYTQIQGLMDQLELGRFPVEYVKSAPYLLSFMNYKVKDKIVAALESSQDYRQVEKSQTMLLRRRQIDHYEEIPCNNGRLQTLYGEAFGRKRNGAELLLWIPASKPYYITENVFSRNAGYSKTLVFSSWEMVPRMVAAMTSYEAERLTWGRLANRKDVEAKRYFGQQDESGTGKKKRAISGRLRDDMETVLCYPSRTLAVAYDPLEEMGHRLSTVQEHVRAKVRESIDQLAAQHGLNSIRRSAGQIVALLQMLDGDECDEPLRGIPAGAEDLLVDLAIGSPAVCALRLFKDVPTPGIAAQQLAEQFVRLFNKPESMAVIDVLYGNKQDDDAYYENVANYCAQGNLQAVLDEYAYTLGGEGLELLKQMKEGFATTASIQVETRESFFGKRKQSKMRTHFAVGYYATRLDDKTVQRTDSIRSAFNSPFRPFVLATTSIGQEGLDFHTYCRKIMHWNLPANPIDLEQREGRINRYLCHAIRQNIAESQIAQDEYQKAVWPELMERASERLKAHHSDLVPFWCLPEDFPYTRKIERIVPMYPFSKDGARYERLLEVLSAYRLTLGQPRQEELLEMIRKENFDMEELQQLYMDLSPWNRKKIEAAAAL